MSDPFVAEIRIVPFNFAPKGWAQCDGQILSLSQNTALFSLLGTTYGGDGKSNFALPNLQGSAPLQPGQGPGLSFYDLGEQAGETAVELLETEIPSHAHTVHAGGAAGLSSPQGNTWGSALKGHSTSLYGSSAGNGNVQMGFPALSLTGNSQPHNNMPPYLGLNFIIALQGVYPARS